ncbi:peptidase inhibitor family I36 protein [Streptomyces sp. NPDC042898]|uniref:peptidase inhibitor family I36 protein n=1 Tax=Streptomyces sp. NPDC042898 TaxID=3154334 RepID=UPI0033D799CE
MSVTVYSDVDYKGKSVTLGAGRHKLDPSMNDVISSVRVPDGWQASIYEHADFTGGELVLEADTARVGEAMNDKASAIVVQPIDDSDEDSRYIFSAENGDNWFYFEDSTSG